MNTIREPARDIPVIEEADIVVVGGSCTGAFAAIRAARLGAKVVLIEANNAFGGTATNGFVCIWHALTDITFKKQIIGGLTEEIIERLKKVPHGIRIRENQDGVPYRSPYSSVYHINTEEMKIELDKMILEAGVIPYLHTRYVAPYMEDGKLSAVIVENRSGRGAIKGKYFVDATADGYLGADVGVPVYYHEGHFQPATTAARVTGWDKLTEPNKVLRSPESMARIGGGRPGWDDSVPGTNIRSWFKSQSNGDCSDADVLTKLEMDGRAQVREMMTILRETDPAADDLALVALCSMIGIRETRQLKCSYQLTEDDILLGKHFDDAIGYCAYPVDVHIPGIPTTFKFMDGTMKKGTPEGEIIECRWRGEDEPGATYWEIPYRCMLPENVDNLLVAGRCVDTDKAAFGAVRVMVSLNQTGEAAGVACYEALVSGKSVQDIDFASFRKRMKDGGSIVL